MREAGWLKDIYLVNKTRIAFAKFWLILTWHDSQKVALASLEQLPDNVTFDEIARRVEVLAALQKGLDSLDRGEGKSIDEVEKLMASGRIK